MSLLLLKKINLKKRSWYIDCSLDYVMEQRDRDKKYLKNKEMRFAFGWRWALVRLPLMLC